jgi:hypothetical protein
VSAHDGFADVAAITVASSAIAYSDLPLAARATAERARATLGCAHDEHLAIPLKVI